MLTRTSYFAAAVAASLMVVALATPWAADAAASGPRRYDVTYRATPEPSEAIIHVEIQVGGERKNLPSTITLTIDPERHRSFSGDGEITTPKTNKVVWELPDKGGTLRYEFLVDRHRGPDRYDARMTVSGAIFRAEHLIPPLSSRSPKGSTSRSSVEFSLPKDWSFYSAYGPGIDGRIDIGDPDRALDQPKGWMIIGEIASRADMIGQTEVRVATPSGSRARRQDTLAFISWTLPTLSEIFDSTPPWLLVVLAPDPFWRGGLSGPWSLFLHADRPLISENRTSTMLHELVHVLSGMHGDFETDWLVEGMAEYYSIEVLRRTGAISRKRYDESIAKLVRWGTEAPSLLVPRSSGPITARAVGVLVRADAEIRKASEGRASLDDLAKKLTAADERISLELLQTLAGEVAGAPLSSFERARLSAPPPSGKSGK